MFRFENFVQSKRAYSFTGVLKILKNKKIKKVFVIYERIQTKFIFCLICHFFQIPDVFVRALTAAPTNHK